MSPGAEMPALSPCTANTDPEQMGTYSSPEQIVEVVYECGKAQFEGKRLLLYNLKGRNTCIIYCHF